MKKQNGGISAEGRTPPPAENRFRKGRSGNPTGRPKGSISISGLTRKVAVKKHSVRLEGKACKVTMLELLILKLNRMAASGQPGVARLINWLRSQTEPHEAEVAAGGFLLAPAAMTSEEFMAEMEARDAGKVEPGTEINIDTEESLKVARGEASPLGEALRSFNEKYGAGPAI